MKKELLLLTLFFVVACKSNNPNIVQKFPEDQRLERKQYAGNMFGNKDGIVVFGGDSKTDTIDTNYKGQQNLWRKSVAFVSSILPISILDENTGLISTDWGSIQSISGNDNLYKLNIIIKGKKIEKDNILVSVFEKDKDGNNKRDTKIEELILNKILN